MRTPDHPTYILRMLQHRLKQLATSSPILAASFGTYTHRCGRPSCRCHHGGPLHTGQHLTSKEGGKTRSVYVPKQLLPEVRTWLAEHRRPGPGQLVRLRAGVRLGRAAEVVVRGDVRGRPHPGLVAGIPSAAGGVPGERAAAGGG